MKPYLIFVMAIALMASVSCKKNPEFTEKPSVEYRLVYASECSNCLVTYRNKDGKLVEFNAAQGFDNFKDSMRVKTGFVAYIKAEPLDSAKGIGNIRITAFIDSNSIVGSVIKFSGRAGIAVDTTWLAP